MSELRTTSLSHKDNNTGTPNITMYPDGTTQLPGTMLGGFKNQVINGDFRVWQRGTTFTSTATTVYTADRWAFGTSNVNSTIAVARTGTAPEGFAGSLVSSNTSPVNGIYQAIELSQQGKAGSFIVGSVWTLSVWANEDISGEAPIMFNFRDGLGNQVNSVAGVASIPNFESTGETSGTFTRYKSTVTFTASPGASNKCLQIGLPGAERIGGAVAYSGVQLEPGPVATPFEHRPMGTELDLCQRYFQRLGNEYVFWQGKVVTNAGISASAPIPQMRAAPSASNIASAALDRFATPAFSKATVNTVRFRADPTGNLDNAFFYVGCDLDAEL